MHSKFLAIIFSAWLMSGASILAVPRDAVPADDDLKSIDNPGGGNIIYGSVPLVDHGQPSPQAALGQMLHNVSLHYGDRPQLGKLLQNHTGDVLAAFFNVTDKNAGGKQISGLVIVSVPQNGPGKAAVLTDDASRFPTTVTSMFRRLTAEVGPSSSVQNGQPAPGSGHAAALRATQFPDGSGVIGLPAGWNLTNAHGGDVAASGPQGEKLRFGIAISVLDPTNPQSRTLWRNPRMPAPGNFVGIPYGTDPAQAFKSASAQLFQKMRKEPPAINVTQVKEIPISGGGHAYWLGGDTDFHDGQGAMSMLVEVIMSQPMALGGWQMTVYEVLAPKSVFSAELPTLGAIFQSYQANGRVIQGQIQADMQRREQETKAFTARVQRDMDNSDRQTQAFCDLLLNQSVVRDTELNGHGRVSDGLADALVQSNPNRFEYVPPSQYIKGIDY
jgi:hypothetical protein